MPDLATLFSYAIFPLFSSHSTILSFVQLLLHEEGFWWSAKLGPRRRQMPVLLKAITPMKVRVGGTRN
jgi:hypothetical protein